MNELKPCPFCGDKIFIEKGIDVEGFGNFYIDHTCDKEPYADVGVTDQNKYTLIKRWNTRTEPPKYETPEPEVAEGLDGDDYNEWLTKGEEEYDKPKYETPEQINTDGIELFICYLIDNGEPLPEEQLQSYYADFLKEYPTKYKPNKPVCPEGTYEKDERNKEFYKSVDEMNFPHESCNGTGTKGDK